MNTFLRVVLILVVVGALGIGALVAAFCGALCFAQQRGHEAQATFFEAVESGQPEQLLIQCDPSLREDIDAPVLAVWMEAFTTNLGEFQGLSVADFATSVDYRNGKSVLKSKGTVRFKEGTAQSELVLIDGKMTRFNVDTKALPDGWFQGPAKSDLYKNRSEKFLNCFLQGDPDTLREQMDRLLQSMASDKTLRDQLEWVTGYAGEIKKMTYVSEAMETKGDLQRLTVRFLVEGSDENLDATVSFQFNGLKGHLVAYHWRPLLDT